MPAGLALFRNKESDIGISLHFRRPFQLCHIAQFLNQPIHQFPPQLLVRHLSSPEDNGSLCLIPFRQESHDVVFLKLKIVLLRLWPEFNFFDGNLLLMLLCFMGPLAFLILEFAVIHNPANRGIGSWSYLHEIHIAGSGNGQSFFRRHDSQLPGLFVDDPYLFCADHFINTNPCWLGYCDWQPPFVIGEKAPIGIYGRTLRVSISSPICFKKLSRD
jgi:hypothetical protein